jgi:DNA-binding MarR family transcriptional regulator
MILESLKFLCPTKLFRELHLLILIDDQAQISQHALAKEMKVTSAMVNLYMKELAQKKMVQMEGETNRQKRYYLTPRGKRRKRALWNEYITGVSDLYSTCKNEFELRLKAFTEQGLRRVVFFGAAETCEIACQSAADTDLAIVGIVDNDPRKHHKKMGEIWIRPPECIEELKPDGVIITALAHADEIYKQLNPLRRKGLAVKKL